MKELIGIPCLDPRLLCQPTSHLLRHRGSDDRDGLASIGDIGGGVIHVRVGSCDAIGSAIRWELGIVQFQHDHGTCRGALIEGDDDRCTIFGHVRRDTDALEAFQHGHRDPIGGQLGAFRQRQGDALDGFILSGLALPGDARVRGTHDPIGTILVALGREALGGQAESLHRQQAQEQRDQKQQKGQAQACPFERVLHATQR